MPDDPAAEPGPDPLPLALAANAARIAEDLSRARAARDAAGVVLLEALLAADGGVAVYRPERHHYAVVLGDVRSAAHLALLVPGVGDQETLVADWIPWGRALLDAAAPGSAVVVWKAYDNPPGFPHMDALAATVDARATEGAEELVRFGDWLGVGPGQRLTVVAHSYGTVVAGEALSGGGLRCSDLVVLGSPGMLVDGRRQLHMAEWHCFAEQAPEDVVAALGAFGTDPASPLFGAVRMATNRPGRPEVSEHSRYFAPGSMALENVADVVTGRYERIRVQRPTLVDVVGSLVTLALRAPFLPVSAWADRYDGPGATSLQAADHLGNVVAAEAGNLVRLALGRVFPGSGTGHRPPLQ